MMLLNTERLRNEIHRNNMRQRDLADRIGVSEVSISRYIHGNRMPKSNTLLKMAAVLCTTPEYLMGTDGFDHPGTAFAKARTVIEKYAKQWTHEQQKELLNKLIDAF